MPAPMFRPTCLLTAVFLFTPLFAANSPTAGNTAAVPSGDVIAQAGSIELAGADVRALLTALPSNERTAISGNLNNLEQVIRAELVRRAVLVEAKTKGFEYQPDTMVQLDRVRDEALVRLWVANHSAPPAGYPSEDEIKSAYEANKQALAAPTEYRIAQIFISASDGGDSSKLAAALRKASAAKPMGAGLGA